MKICDDLFITDADIPGHLTEGERREITSILNRALERDRRERHRLDAMLKATPPTRFEAGFVSAVMSELTDVLGR